MTNFIGQKDIINMDLMDLTNKKSILKQINCRCLKYTGHTFIKSDNISYSKAPRKRDQPKNFRRLTILKKLAQ